MHARGSGEAAQRAKRGRTRVAICVSRVLLDGLQKRETARSLNENVQLVLPNLGQNELKSGVACFTIDVQTCQQPDLLQDRLMWVVKRATPLFNSFCSNVARQVACFLLRVFPCLNFSTEARSIPRLIETFTKI